MKNTDHHQNMQPQNMQLQNMQPQNTQSHIPVMLEESISALSIKKDGFYIDGSFGRGGHARHILQQLGKNGSLLVIDKDIDAIKSAESLAKSDNRVIVKHGSFKNIADFCTELNVLGSVDGILLDLGVSSVQLDSPERGFSFMHDGPLDMRMDNTSGISAAVWLASAAEAEITEVLRVYGEEKFALKIARAIIDAREKEEITTTKKLVSIISSVVFKKEKHKHPATRSFQAIRIFINNELQDLNDFLQSVKYVLAVHGRLAIISFHSLEDRIVKRFIQNASKSDTHPKDFPIEHSKIKPADFVKIGKFILPSKNEVAANIRSRSAKLRVLEKAGTGE